MANKPPPSIDPTERRACDADVRVGCSIPAVNGCTQSACNDGLDGRTDDQKYCRDLGGGQSECANRLRWEDRYTIAHVPTNVELAIRVTGPNGMASSPWANTMNANVILLTTDRACTSAGDSGCLDTSTTPTSYRLDVEVVSQADYENLPAAAQGIISKGHGAIFGELHDCDDVRVGNVIVGTQPESQRFTYYNGDPIHTAPDIIRFPMGTDRLGKFAAIDFAPGACRRADQWSDCRRPAPHARSAGSTRWSIPAPSRCSRSTAAVPRPEQRVSVRRFARAPRSARSPRAR